MKNASINNLINLREFSGKSFKKQCNTTCYLLKTSGSYTSLLAAQHACREDAGCGKVVDVGCDFKDGFKLCSTRANGPSDIGSCIYIDETKSIGKISFSFCIRNIFT